MLSMLFWVFPETKTFQVTRTQAHTGAAAVVASSEYGNKLAILDTASSVVEIKEREHYEYDEFFPGPYSTDTMQQVYASYPGPTDGTQEIAVPEWAGFRRDAAWSFTTTLAFGDYEPRHYPLYTNAIATSPVTETITGWNGGDPALNWALRFRMFAATEWNYPFVFQGAQSNNYMNLYSSNGAFNHMVLQWRTHTPQGTADAYAGGLGRIKVIVDMSAYSEVEVLLSHNSQGYTHDGGGSQPDLATTPNGHGLSYYWRGTTDGGASYDAWNQVTVVGTEAQTANPSDPSAFDEFNEDDDVTWSSMTASFGFQSTTSTFDQATCKDVHLWNVVRSPEDYDDAATVASYFDDPPPAEVTYLERGPMPAPPPPPFSYGAVTAIAQLGADIDGEAEGDRIGRSVALSGDGTILAVGARYNDASGTSAGHVRVFEWSSGSWSQLGSDIDGEAANDQSGYSVSLSLDGTILAVGASYNDGTGSNAGPRASTNSRAGRGPSWAATLTERRRSIRAAGLSR